MNRRALHILGILAIMLAVFGGLLSAGTTMAAPPAQVEVEEEVGATGSGFSQVSTDVQRGVLSLAAQAANAGRWALVLVESDPGVGFAGGQFGLEDEQGLGQEVNILTPSTQLGLRTTYEVLDTLRDSLEDYQLIAQQDIAEEVEFQSEILEGLEIEEGQGLIEEEEGAAEALTEEDGAALGQEGDVDVTNLGAEEDLLGQDLDITVNVVETQCGDLDTQVAVMQSDIARALGFRAFGITDEVDPDARLLALDALRSHYLELRQTLNCLSGLVGEGIGGVGQGIGGLGQGIGGVGEGIGENLGEGLGVGEGIAEDEGILDEGLGEGVGEGLDEGVDEGGAVGEDVGEEDFGDEFIIGGNE